MRPRKVILVVHANERECGMWKFLLQVRGYNLLMASDAPSALALHAPGVDLVLGFADGMLREWAQLAERMKATMPEIPVILVTRLKSPESRLGLAPWADAVYGQSSTAELLEWIRMRMVRKRGPRRVALVPAAMAGD